MEALKLFEGIALLIELAQQGEIDPWDVQVIEVIDRYLSELIMAQEETQAACEADLSQSGQAFLSASMLVLLKANTLIELDAPADDPSEVFAAETEAGAISTRMRLPLEQQLRRRPAALPPPKRRVALKELIDQLQLMATQLQAQQSKPSIKTLHARRNHQSRSQTARAIAQLAHQENLTEVAGELEQFLHHRSQSLDPEQDWLNLDQLVDLWAKTKQPAPVASSDHNGDNADVLPGEELQHSGRHPGRSRETDPSSVSFKAAPESSEHLPSQHNDRVSVFWALLLLSAQSKVELAQEEFYQEIKIRALEVK